MLTERRTPEDLKRENEELRAQLEEARETLRAIRMGEVDALVVSTCEGDRIYTLEGADQAYRTLIEQMQETAVTLIQDGCVLYANSSFSEMLGLPLEKVVGTPFRDYVVEPDRGHLDELFKKVQAGRARGELSLRRGTTGEWVPVLLGLSTVTVNGARSVCAVVVDLTERRRARQIFESERFIRRLIESAPVGVAVVGRDLRYLLANPAYQRTVAEAGEADVPLAGRTVAEVFRPEVARMVQQSVQRVLESGESLKLVECQMPSSDRRWWNIIKSPLHGPTGQVEAVLIFREDVTERKLAVDQLRRSEARLRGFFESDMVGAIYWTMDGKINDANDKFLRMVGYTREELTAGLVDWARMTPPEYRHLDERALEELRATGVDTPYEKEYIRKDGTRIPVIIGAAMLDERRWEGVAFVLDNSARKQALEALRASEERLRMAAEAGRVGTWDLDYATGRLRWGGVLYELAGLRPEEWDETFEGFLRVLHPDDREPVVRAIDEAIASRRENYALEYRFVLPGGQVRWMRGQGRILWDENGRPIRNVSAVVDITERKLAEEALAAAKAAAESANAAKDQFLATLSHELRTPLTPVLILSQQLEADPHLSAELREDMKTIRQNIQVEARLIEDLLDLTRISRGKIQLKPEPVNVHDLLQHAMQTCCDEQFDKRGLHIEWRLAARSRVVTADSTRLQQVFWNLISNAIKFTPPGGAITIRTADLDANHIRIQVSDTGKGIEPDKLATIFNPFDQGSPDTPCHYGGLGLGLAIAKAIVEMHGGTITADSKSIGQGATFTVTLATAVQKEAPAGGAGPAPAGEERHDGRAPRILLVEDHQPTAFVLARMFKRWGWESALATSVKSALDLAGKQSFDLVISDLGLPDGSGHDLMQQLRDAHGLKGIALSGYGMESDVEKSLASGFVVHLVKPLNFEDLRHAVMAFMAGAARR